MSPEQLTSPTPTSMPTSSITSAISPESTPGADEGERQAEKRVAIGLSPRRPTARTAVQRPPGRGLARWQQWFMAMLVVALLTATSLLILARVIGSPTDWPQVRLQLAAWILGQPLPRQIHSGAPAPGYQLKLTELFATKSDVLACNQQAGQWTTDIIPERGIYQIQLWPGRLAWSTLAMVMPLPYWLEAGFTIVDVMPTGYGGLLARYQDADNFYFFVVDGAGQYQVLLWQNAQLTTLIPWLPHPALNPAGYENWLALEDDGQALHFYANGQPIFSVETPLLPPGGAGVVGGAGERTMAEIEVDWLRLYEQE